MAGIEIVGLNEVRSLLRNVKNGANRALSSSINKSLITARKIESQEIRKDLNVKAKVVKEHIRLYKANPSKPTGKLTTKGKPLAFVTSQGPRFSGRRLKSGIWGFTIKKKRGRKKFRNAFLLRFRTGHVGIFIRRASAAGRERSFGLKELYTTRVSDMAANEELNLKVRQTAAVAVNRNLLNAANYLIRRG